MSFSTFLLIDARDKLKEAKAMKCSCSGFVLQYEGGCQCEKSQKIAGYEKKLALAIERLS